MVKYPASSELLDELAMRGGTATRPRAAMNVDYDGKKAEPFRHAISNVEIGFELHRFVIFTDHGRVGV